MSLNKNYMSKYVIGKEYSYSTLKSMSKDALIELLNIAQHNYECVNERLFNLIQYAEKLDKALDLACQELGTQDVMLFNLLLTWENRNYPTQDKQEWYQYLMEGATAHS